MLSEKIEASGLRSTSDDATDREGVEGNENIVFSRIFGDAQAVSSEAIDNISDFINSGQNVYKQVSTALKNADKELSERLGVQRGHGLEEAAKRTQTVVKNALDVKDRVFKTASGVSNSLDSVGVSLGGFADRLKEVLDDFDFSFIADIGDLVEDLVESAKERISTIFDGIAYVKDKIMYFRNNEAITIAIDSLQALADGESPDIMGSGISINNIIRGIICYGKSFMVAKSCFTKYIENCKTNAEISFDTVNSLVLVFSHDRANKTAMDIVNALRNENIDAKIED